MPKDLMKGTNWIMLAGFVVLCELAGIIGAVFTSDAIPSWYANLNKPFFTPPPWVSGPAWTTLYLLMGTAAYLVWEKGLARKEIRTALGLFGTQLALNTAWSIAFFGLRSPWAGVAVIALLWLSIAATTRAFWGISRNAGYFMVPYIMWVSFAAILNVAVALLNP